MLELFTMICTIIFDRGLIRALRKDVNMDNNMTMRNIWIDEIVTMMTEVYWRPLKNNN
jgi:hypothetical protein